MNRSQHNEIMALAASSEKSRLSADRDMADVARFSSDFERIFGSGDEVQVKPLNTSQAMFDAGFKQSDF